MATPAPPETRGPDRPLEIALDIKSRRKKKEKCLAGILARDIIPFLHSSERK
jgi:hypothetical protein